MNTRTSTDLCFKCGLNYTVNRTGRPLPEVETDALLVDRAGLGGLVDWAGWLAGLAGWLVG